ncbi:replicase [Gregarina niphandrodes]|uniref:Replicase n=1 Tax=Gregarina niphandrodes TaxID=110365 RepID=A0A023AW01_GRENI|nr:replicase [Gregarina niphandrodes]EZG42884.1 replicase [Gregarina niphandrodes]|eukprot:XP_011133836.1 replicase [Gregarina niphandrodes]
MRQGTKLVAITQHRSTVGRRAHLDVETPWSSNCIQQTLKKVTFARPKPEVIVLWGPPGTGKSHTARAVSDDYYVKPAGPWWDGYFGQELVIFDDFYGSEKFCDMLRWLSENPIKVPIKGSMTDLLATKFIITSNVEPERWYPHVENKDALMRRITDIIYMNEVYCPK